MTQVGWPSLGDPLRVALLTAVSLAFAAASYR